MREAGAEGGAALITENTRVSKDQAIAAVIEAFKDKPEWHTMPIRDIALGVPMPEASGGAGSIGGTPRTTYDTTGKHWITSGQRMNQWYAKAEETTPRRTLTMGGQTVVSGALGSVAQGGGGGGCAKMTWLEVLNSGPLTRDERMQKVRTMFEALDGDHDRVVTKDEFIVALQADGIEVNKASALFKEMDETRTGRLTIAKFDHVVAMHTLKIISTTYKSLDPSHERQITREELMRYFLGNGLDKQQASRLWDSMDINHNGKINFVEYRDWAQETLQSTSLDQVSVSLGLS